MIHRIRHAYAPRCGACMARVPTYVRTTSAHAVRVPPRAVQRLPLGVRPGAAGSLACAGVQVQVATTPWRGNPTCHDTRMHQPSLYSYIPSIGTVPSYMRMRMHTTCTQDP